MRSSSSGFFMSSIFLTLDGKLSAKHHIHDIICREDGAVFSNGRWTFGGKYTKRYLGIGYKNKNYYIHRLIAESFLPNPLKKYSVDHINRITTDNSLTNLRWATQKEQLENSNKVLGRFDCGVRKCDDTNAWKRVRYHMFIEKEHERSRIKHLKKRLIQTISMLFILKNRFCLE